MPLREPAGGGAPGTTKQQIGHLELGKRHLTDTWMRRIAAALGVSLFDLLNDAAPVLDEQETALLSLFRSLTKGQRDALYRAITALAQPAADEDAPDSPPPPQPK